MPKNTDQPAGVVCLIRSLTAALKAMKAKVEVESTKEKLRVACFSMGSWGTGVARQVGQSLLHLKRFKEALPVWVPAMETVTAMNETGFDERHLPGLRLPRNVHATVDPVEAFRRFRTGRFGSNGSNGSNAVNYHQSPGYLSFQIFPDVHQMPIHPLNCGLAVVRGCKGCRSADFRGLWGRDGAVDAETQGEGKAHSHCSGLLVQMGVKGNYSERIEQFYTILMFQLVA